MRRVAIVMWSAGFLSTVLSIWTIERPPTARFALEIVAMVSLLAILVLVVFQPRRRLLEASAFASIVVLSLMVRMADPLDLSTFFYLWPLVFLAHFASARKTFWAFALTALTLFPALAFNSSVESTVGIFFDTMWTVGLMTALVASLTAKESRLRAALSHAADTDPLTGLLNRRSFNPMLDALVDQVAELGRGLSVVMLDLDHFKRLNDTYGHAIGDRVLQEVAGALRRYCRDDDLVARLGGEEFAVALPKATAADARAYTERVADALSRLDVAEGLTVSVSAGIVSLTEGHGTGETLLSRADDALYSAKEGGRCRHATWGSVIEVGPAFSCRTVPSLASAV